MTDARVRDAVPGVRFFSATYRLFKLPALEPACEDYGQAVIYRGMIPHHADSFTLGRHHVTETGRTFAVCGNTFDMLRESRFREHFDFVGSKSKHYGSFPGCGTAIPFDASEAAASGGCC